MQYFELRIDSPWLKAQLFQQIGEITWWDSQVAWAHNPKVRGSNPLPATIYIYNYINTLISFFCLKIRSLYFYTPRYTPHTFQFFQTSLLFQTQEVQTNLAWCCLLHSRPKQLPHEHSSINCIFIELPEYLSLAKKYSIKIELLLDEKLLVKEDGEQNWPFRLSRISHPSTPGRIWQTGFPCIERRLLGWAERVTLKLIENVRARQLKKFN